MLRYIDELTTHIFKLVDGFGNRAFASKWAFQSIMEMLLTLSSILFKSNQNARVRETADRIIASVVSYASKSLFGKIPQGKILSKECE